MGGLDSTRRKELAKIIDEDLGIPAFPAVAHMAITALGKPGTSAGQLSEILTKDQGLATSILRTVNSAYYGLRTQVETVKQAVVFLGMRAVRWLVVSAAAGKLYKRHAQIEKTLWAHSMGAALAARLLAEASAGNSEEAALAGLMHDVGKVVMNNESPDRFGRSLARAGAEGLLSSEAEQAVFGYTHEDVGTALILRWNMSQTLANAVFMHHDYDLAEAVSDESLPLISTTTLADKICHHLAIGTNREPVEIDCRLEPAALKLGLEPERLAGVIERVRSTHEQEKELFG